MSDFISFDTTWFGLDPITIILMLGFAAACLGWYWWDHR